MREHYGFSIPGTEYYKIDDPELHKVGRPVTYDMTPEQFVARESLPKSPIAGFIPYNYVVFLFLPLPIASKVR